MSFGSGLFGQFDEPEPPPESQESESLLTDENRPWLGVHVLSEFMFCPRAGLLAYERGQTDAGDERLSAPRLDYLPNYEAEIIREKLDQVEKELKAAGIVVAILILTVVVVSNFDGLTAALIGVASLIGVPWASERWQRFMRLQTEWRDVTTAKEREPDPKLGVVQQVNWWDMLQAGFESVEPQEAHRDPGRRLSGRPFRLLRRGAVCIPVFRTSQSDRELHRQHRGRLAAYAELIETCEGAQVPYGLILYGASYEADAVPITADARQVFEKGYQNAHLTIAEKTSRKLDPDKPTNEKICRGCHLGRPRLYRPGQSELKLGKNIIIPLLTRHQENGNKYHSDCGDRFFWVPKHESAIEKGLTD